MAQARQFNQQATASWKAVQARYQVVKAAGGQLSWALALRDRVRYFTRGGVLGTREFVDRIFGLKKDRFPDGRNDGAGKMRRCDWGTMMALRDLRD
jgi:pullulanase/glycogen debranching enzyme